MTQQLKPIKPKKIADQVFDQLHDLILREQFKPGEKIMTERALAEALQVSRSSVRDAVNKLVVMGMHAKQVANRPPAGFGDGD